MPWCSRSRAASSATTARCRPNSASLLVENLLQQLLNGITWGSIYALIALGYTMVYGVLKLINFAHGEVYMMGAMSGYYAARWLGLSREPSLGGLAAVLLISMVVCGLLGALIERVAYR